MNGVTRCLVGYSGGLELNPTYRTIMDHTEALLIEYDPTIIGYNDILQQWKDLGGEVPYPSSRQYRSGIFTTTPEQETEAIEYKEALKQNKYVYVEPATRFYMAEEYHQDFLEKSNRM
mmetsp:Transcript_15682/g.20450  ORF Transcript_15682/g.20450 Transcript_15682/m.20450 type:complete len:118 (+) Transcript_15682:429-782(+)